MSQKILVTGASGFIGAHTILELLNNGYDVRGTVRDLSRTDSLREMFSRHSERASEIEFVQASLTEKDCWQGAIEGCDGVIHIASPVPLVMPKDPEEIIKPAKEGALNVLHAAKEAGIKRVVLTSSVAAVSGNADACNKIQTANDWTDTTYKDVNAYAMSKTIAEKAAWDFVNSVEGIELVTVNPALVLGPALEADYGSSLEAILKLLRGDVPLVPKLGFGVVDVRDVAGLHRLALENPDAAGQRLLCSNGFVWFKDIALQLRHEFPDYEKKIPRYDMPNFLVRIAGIFDKVIAEIVPDLDKVVQYDSSPAKQLGWQPRAIEEAISAGAKSLVEFKVV